MSELKNEIKKVVLKLISILTPRNREIVSRRFGLKTGTKETLESIGSTYGITRERVRQIEEASLTEIRKDMDRSLIAPFVEFAEEALEASDGVVRESELFFKFSGTEASNSTNAAFAFALTLSGTLYRSADDDDFHAFWSVSKDRAGRFRDETDAFIRDLATTHAVASSAIPAALALSKNIGKNVFGEIGLVKWSEIRPRGVRDKSYLILKREGKPRHFREIAELINAAGFGTRRAHLQTVHNELIKDDRFVLVGRGMYGLKEWGYEAGTVKEVIASLIRSKGPQSKEKIIAHVMNVRMVKPNTVLLGIQDKKLFVENEEGHIALREA